jgi:hypothetical protein
MTVSNRLKAAARNLSPLRSAKVKKNFLNFGRFQASASSILEPIVSKNLIFKHLIRKW